MGSIDGFYLDGQATMPRDPLKINLFTAGDSADPSTWSNFPYYLSEALIEHGVDLRRVNMIPGGSTLYRLYRAVRYKADGLSKRFTGKRRPINVFHDRTARWLIERGIHRAARELSDADFNFFLTYSYTSQPTISTPTVHLSDICLQHALVDQGLPVNGRQRRLIEHEKASLSCAVLVLATNEPCSDYLREHYGVAGVRRLQGGPNLNWQTPEDMPAYLDKKWDARRVLFIGRGVHKRGVDLLVHAFEQFNADRAEPYTLTILGVGTDELGPLPPGVVCIDNLNKNDPAELARYTALLESATMFVMPMREGPPPGVTKEALLTGTPVVISNIWNADTKIEHNRCGRLVDRIDAQTFAKEMQRIAEDRERWHAMAERAMVFAEQWSWSHSVGELVEDLIRLREEGQP